MLSSLTNFFNVIAGFYRHISANRRAMLLTGVVSTPVLAACWFTSETHVPDHNIATYAILISLTLLSSCMPVYISDKRFALSPTLPMTMAACYLFGPWVAVSIAMLNAVFAVLQMFGFSRSSKLLGRIGWGIVMNCGLGILATGIPSLAYSCLYTHHIFSRHSLTAGCFCRLRQFYRSISMRFALLFSPVFSRRPGGT